MVSTTAPPQPVMPPSPPPESLPVSPPPAVPSAPPPIQQYYPNNPAPLYEYAGFWTRFFASFVDGLIVGVAVVLISFPLGLISALLGGAGNSVKSGVTGAGFSLMGMVISLISGIIQFTIPIAYYVYFIGKNGQTIGKKALNIKVVNPDTLLPPGYGSAFLRECIGKIISMMIFYLGYLWMLWDDKKQTWHDKIAHTIVIRT